MVWQHVGGRPVGRQAGAAVMPPTEPVVVARSVEEVESLREAWQQSGVSDIDSDLDYFLTVVQNATHVLRPHVVHVPREGSADLLAVARIERIELPLSVGYRKLGALEARAVVVAFGGLAGAESAEDHRILLDCLQEPIRQGEADLLVLRDVDVDGTTAALAADSAPWWRRSHGQTVSTRWLAPVPDSLDEFLGNRSAKTRQTLRRQDRRLVKSYGDRLRLRRYTALEDLEAVCSDMQTVAARTYQHGLGAAFSASPLELALMRVGLAQGWYRVWMLYVDDEPVAFWSGTTFGKTFATGTPGFDPAFTRDSVGRYTMFRMVEDLCLDARVSMLDFGHGEAEYKAAYGEPARQETTVMIAARRWQPIVHLAVVSGVSLLNTTGRKLVARSELARRAKRSWRQHLAGG